MIAPPIAPATSPHRSTDTARRDTHGLCPCHKQISRRPMPARSTGDRTLGARSSKNDGARLAAGRGRSDLDRLRSERGPRTSRTTARPGDLSGHLHQEHRLGRRVPGYIARTVLPDQCRSATVCPPRGHLLHNLGEPARRSVVGNVVILRGNLLVEEYVVTPAVHGVEVAGVLVLQVPEFLAQ
jgi:hypothetical protein